jgi:replication-associated recombination protein RarA
LVSKLMANLALHSTTAQQLERYVAAPSHAVLLVGPTGVGKGSVAGQLAEQLLGLSAGTLTEYAYLRQITSVDGKAIGIEPIRELEHFLSLIVPGQAAIRRVIIIEQAQLLTIEAQNALLKTLEEPPVDTVIIMTAPSSQTLLPTVQSRLQTISVIKPTKAELLAAIPTDASTYAISGGLPGLLHAMTHDQTHPLAGAVATARELLGQTSYERLLQVDRLAKDKQLALDTLTILQQMAHISLQNALGTTADRWRGILSASYDASVALSASAQPKLALSDLMLRL